MILADTPEQRQAALDRLLPLQRADFRELFDVMSPNPVTIRLLNPPIYELRSRFAPRLEFQAELGSQVHSRSPHFLPAR